MWYYGVVWVFGDSAAEAVRLLLPLLCCSAQVGGCVQPDTDTSFINTMQHQPLAWRVVYDFAHGG